MFNSKEFYIENLIVYIPASAKHEPSSKVIYSKPRLADSVPGFIGLGCCVVGNLFCGRGLNG